MPDGVSISPYTNSTQAQPLTGSRRGYFHRSFAIPGATPAQEKAPESCKLSGARISFSASPAPLAGCPGEAHQQGSKDGTPRHKHRQHRQSV